jgi:hypothetical protein
MQSGSNWGSIYYMLLAGENIMNLFTRHLAFIFFFFSMAMLPAGCGGGGGGDNNPQSGSQSDVARFYFDCDLQGLTGKMVMDIEVISSSGITWGPGPDPEITGVIGTGDYIIYTEGTLNSPTSAYVFTGENEFADFTEVNTYERFRVQWVEASNGLIVIVNPFGEMSTQHACILTDSERL